MTYTAAQVAEIAHEANRVLQYAQGDPLPSVPWACESEHVRALTVRGVERVRAGVTPQANHEAWCADKRAAGWRYGPVKDPEARTHPALLPYDQLPECQRDKDRVFTAIVRELSPRPNWIRRVLTAIVRALSG